MMNSVGYRLVILALVCGVLACGEDASTPPIEDTDLPDTEMDFGLDLDETDMGSDGGEAPDMADMAPDVIDETTEYFEAVRGVRDALRLSPDHLEARAEALVEAGDAEGLYELVRNEIALVPAVRNNLRPEFREDADSVMAGPRAALRSGAGTMRDRAELLAHLYREAGWQAEVVGPLEDGIARADYETALFEEVEHEFNPQADEEDIAAWEARFGTNEGDGMEFMQADTSGLESLLLDEIPMAERGSVAADGSVMLELPIVRLERGGTTTHLDVVNIDATFTDRSDAASLTAMPEPDYADIRVGLSYVSTRNLDTWQPVLDRVWQANQLEGRQLELRFSTAGSFEESLAQGRANVNVASPVLLLQDPELSDEDRLALSAFGDAITLQGNRISEDAEGQLYLNGKPFASDDQVGPVDEVDLLNNFEIDAAAFSQVRLYVEAEDANGQGVAGLGAGAFAVYEEGELVPHALERSTVAPLEVLLLIDTSGSVNSFWKDPAFAAHIGGVVDDLQSQYAGEVRFSANNVAAPLTTDSVRPFVSAGSELEAQLNTIYSNFDPNDPVWGALLKTAQLDHDLTVVISDAGDQVDPPDPSDLVALETGPEVLFLGPNGFSGAVDLMVQYTSGQKVEIQAYADVDTPLTEWVQRQPQQAYEIVYRAPADGPDTRSVELRTSDDRVMTSDTYTVPPLEDRVTSEALLGVRLEITVDGRRSTRVLGGVDPALLSDVPDIDAARADLQRMTKTQYSISFESQAPLSSQWLDDYLSMRLTQETMFRAYHQGDTEIGRAALDESFQHVDPRLFTSYPAPRDAFTADRRTFASGPRVAITSENWDIEAQRFRRTFDILPTSRYVTRVANENSDFEATFRETARFAIAEAMTFDRSTVSMLQGQTITRIAAGSAFDPATEFSATPDDSKILWWNQILDEYAGWHRFVPADGQTQALWVVQPDTGEVYGLIDDGRGGGDQLEFFQGYDEIEEVIEEIDALSDALVGASGAGLSVALIVEYYKTLIRIYALVTIVIKNLDASKLEEGIKVALLGMVCNFIQTVIFDLWPAAERWYNIFDTLTTIFGIENPGECPDPFD